MNDLLHLCYRLRLLNSQNMSEIELGVNVIDINRFNRSRPCPCLRDGGKRN